MNYEDVKLIYTKPKYNKLHSNKERGLAERKRLTKQKILSFCDDFISLQDLMKSTGYCEPYLRKVAKEMVIDGKLISERKPIAKKGFKGVFFKRVIC